MQFFGTNNYNQQSEGPAMAQSKCRPFYLTEILWWGLKRFSLAAVRRCK